MQLELAPRLYDALGAVGIAFAGQLDNDLVVASAVRSDQRLGQAQGVNPAANRLLGLVHGLLLDVCNPRGRNGEDVSGFARRRSDLPIGKLILHQVADRARLLRRDIVHQDLRIVQLAQLLVLDVLFPELRHDALQHLVRFLADRLLHLYLEDEVRAALQVQAELDVVGEIRLDAGPRSRLVRHAHQPNKTGNNDGGDEKHFPLEVRTHGLNWLGTFCESVMNPAWLLLLAFRLEAGHGGARHFYFHLVGDPELNRVAFEADNRAVNPATGHDLVPILESPEHLRRFLLAPLGGKNHQHIEDYHDDQQRQERHDPAGALRH